MIGRIHTSLNLIPGPNIHTAHTRRNMENFFLPPAASAPLLKGGTRSDNAHVGARRLDDVLTVGGDALRGVPLSSLLRDRAALFADGGAAAREDPVGCYALSQPVESLSHFCSHSWSASRHSKWLALTFHFNMAPAIALVFAALAFTFHVELFRFEAILSGQFTLQTTAVTISYTPLCSLVVCTLLPALLFFGHHLFGSARRARLFLDVSCINQSDEEQKAAGIAALGAVLDRSEKMLILSEETYWSRAWCIFEVAAFAHRAGLERCVFVPMHVAMLDVSMLAYGIMYNLMPICGAWLGLGHSLIVQFALGFGGVAVPQILMLAAFVQGRKSRRALEALARFSLEDVKCYAPEDKAEILRMIGSWFTDASTGESDPDVLQQIGIHRFTTFVRYNLRLHMQRSSEDWSRLKLLAVAVTIPWLLDTVASPDVSVVEALVQMGLNTLSWTVFGFDVWFTCVSKLADLAAYAIDHCGCTPALVYTTLVVPLAVLILLLSAACSAMSGIPFTEIATGARQELLGAHGVLSDGAEVRAVKMGMMLVLAGLLQPFVSKVMAEA